MGLIVGEILAQGIDGLTINGGELREVELGMLTFWKRDYFVIGVA